MVKFTTVTWYSQLLAIILGFVILFIGIFIGMRIAEDRVTEPFVTIEDEVNEVPEEEKIVTGFDWENPVTAEVEGVPSSEVYVVIKYADGTDERKYLDSISGTCNAEPVETTLALDSQQFICYYAGLGHRFRVIENQNKYLVQQQTFEEALPTNEGEPLSEFETKFTIAK